MAQADFAYQPANDVGAALAVSIYADRPQLREQMCDDALRLIRIDENLRRRPLAAGEHLVQRGDAGRDNEVRAGARGPLVEPDERRGGLRGDFGAVEQDDFA